MEKQYYRTFVGVPVKPGPGMLALRSELMASLSGERISWVTPELYHVTLRFIGDTSTSAIEAIRTSLKHNLLLPKAIEIDLKGVGSFGPRKRPRVIWLGFKEVELFKTLKRQVDRALESSGIQQEEHPYNPHLTLGRVRSLKDPEAYYGCIDRLAETELEPALIDSVVYYRSMLGPEGPRYTNLDKYNFG
jgi:2'-5' RNA ligase